ncbi:hypothetical protein BLA29_002568 [Euroglyphus maynei]|uniref:Uncharacterized protein n=1 Tax=Euroglyphus maynei TaxID=6958 RepID=A0A1Y3BJH0_EURMA|nr:hypothetical protein BLA29_002568 [Euroglyphus maynei]
MNVQKNRDYRILIEQNSSSEKFFLLRFPQLQQRLVRIDHHDVTSAETVIKLVKGKHVLITDRWRGFVIKRNYPKLDIHISNEGFGQTFGFLAIRKDLHYPARRMLVKMYSKIFQTGITERKLIEKTFNETNELMNAATDQEFIDADNEDDEVYINNRLISLVYIHILGLTLSLIVFIAEFFYSFFFVFKYK